MSTNKTDWTKEQRADVVSRYTEANPTPETTIELVKSIAEDLDRSSNAIRMVLLKEEVYIKGGKAVSTDSKKTKKVSKQDSIDLLTDVIEANELEVDEEILSKLTGKAAVYFHKLFTDLVG